MAEMDQTKIPETPKAEEMGKSDDEQKPIYNSIQMSDAIRREREKALLKGKQMALEEFQQQQAAQTQQAQPAAPVQQPQAPGSMGGMANISPDQIRQMIAAEMPNHLSSHLQQQTAARQAEGFVQKMKAAEVKHPGLEAKLEKLDWTHMGPVIRLIDSTANPGDVMKELLDNPMKMGNILTLAHQQPTMAAQAMQELSNSIAVNTQAEAQEKHASEPLSPISPSNVGSDTGIKGSVRDFKNRYKG